MRIYQSETGEYIATDDAGIKARGKTAEKARAAFLKAGGVEDAPAERPERPERRRDRE